MSPSERLIQAHLNSHMYCPSVPEAPSVLGLHAEAADRRREQCGQRWKTELLALMVMPQELGRCPSKLIPGRRSKMALSAWAREANKGRHPYPQPWSDRARFHVHALMPP